MHLHIWATTTLLFLIGSAFSNSVVDTAGENEASNLRIIGGITAQTGQYPFMASVLSPRSACAGTLIAPSYVLTAAHCVSLPSSGNMMEMLNSKVFLNTLFVAGKAGTNSVTNYISKIIVHENYSVNGTGYVNDIAIIVLEFPVTKVTPVRIAEETTTTQTKTTTEPTTMTTTEPTTKTTTKTTTKPTTMTTTEPTTKTTTKPTTMTTTKPTTKTTTKTTTKPTTKTTTKPTTRTTKPTAKTTKKPALIRNSYENSNAIIAGWGLTSNGGYSSEMLKAINVKIFTNQDCGQKWGNLFDANTMMCAAGSTGSICVDDEGGPIIVSGFQVGIASFFSKSNQCNDPKAPAVFTRVSAYASWIAKTMAKNPPPIPSI
ncbi:cell wall protein DAN4-like [Daphnia pulex]|uniref:cell wall protein DAN4-like n=1 Tax=Daphnia pulex TaxID=6669 RepID=UPI001EDEF2CB|nr:cell wall protein DAN4-like [Daphnia pulex]